MLTPKFNLTSLLIIFASLAFTWADYYIDDSNSSVQYVPSTFATSRVDSWFPMNTISGNYIPGTPLNYTRLYDQTLTTAFCNTTDFCQIYIPFNGSGITIYGVLLPGATNFIVSLDGKKAPAPVGLSPIPNSAPPIYNATLYDIQSLSLSFHTLTISVAPWDNSWAWTTFDYAYVTEMSQSPTSSSISSSSLSPSASTLGGSVSSHHPHFVVGAVVGGIIAGLMVIAIGVSLVLYFRRRAPRVAEETEANLTPFDADNSAPQPPHAPQPLMAYSPTTSLLLPNQPSSIVSAHGQNSQTQLVESPSSNEILIPPMSSTHNMDSGVGHSNATSSEFPMKGHRSSSPQSNSSGDQLTAEQADFVHTLYSHNIPAPAIARVMERMMGREEAGASGENPVGAPNLERENTIAPPRYTSDSSF